MRNNPFLWAFVMLVMCFSFILLLTKVRNITGYSVADTAGDSPVYLSTFVILFVVIIFFMIIIAGFGIHAKRNLSKEQESIKNLIKNMK